MIKAYKVQIGCCEDCGTYEFRGYFIDYNQAVKAFEDLKKERITETEETIRRHTSGGMRTLFESQGISYDASVVDIYKNKLKRIMFWTFKQGIHEIEII